MSTKRQQDYIHEDIVRLLNPDCNRPFSNFEDAVDRLLPFHVSHAFDEEKKSVLRLLCTVEQCDSGPSSSTSSRTIFTSRCFRCTDAGRRRNGEGRL